MSFRRQVLRNRTIGKDGLLLLWIIGRAVLALAPSAPNSPSGCDAPGSWDRAS